MADCTIQNKAKPRIRGTAKQNYDFPTSAAGISGNNDRITITDDGIAIVTYTYLTGQSYSQFGLHVNDIPLVQGGNFTSGFNDLGGFRQIVTFPVYKGDVVRVSFYATYAMAAINLRVF